MKFLLLAPAKAYLVECKAPFRMIAQGGHNVAVFDNMNTYVKTDGKEPSFSYSKTPGYNSYAFEIDGVLCYVTNAQDDSWFWHRVDMLNEADLNYISERIYGKAREAISDLEGYNARLDKKMAMQRAAYAEKKKADDAARLERERLAVLRDARAQAEAEKIFATGGRITWPHFETACKAYGVPMAPGTLGAGRKSIRFIGVSSADYIGNGTVARGIWTAARDLKAVLEIKNAGVDYGKKA